MFANLITDLNIAVAPASILIDMYLSFAGVNFGFV